MRILIFEKFCAINFCECLSLKNFARLIFAKEGEIRKNKYRKNFYITRFYSALINPHKVALSGRYQFKNQLLLSVPGFISTVNFLQLPSYGHQTLQKWSESNTLCLVLSCNFLANIFWEAVNGCPWVLRSRSE